MERKELKLPVAYHFADYNGIASAVFDIWRSGTTHPKRKFAQVFELWAEGTLRILVPKEKFENLIASISGR